MIVCLGVYSMTDGEWEMAPVPPEQCHGDSDGECHWERCPQLDDGEPVKSGRHCPIDRRER